MAGQAIALGLLISLPISAVGALLASRLLAVMGATPGVIETGAPFASIMLLGNATILMLFVINAIFRGAGDAALSMRVLWFSNALNMALGPCFIFGLGPFPELGVAGAAVGTTLGRGAGVALQVFFLTRGSGRVRVRARHLVPDPGALAALLRLFANGALQNVIGTASWIGMVAHHRALRERGARRLRDRDARHRVRDPAGVRGSRTPPRPWSGQNLGAGRPDRAEAAVYRAGIWTTVMLGAVGVVFAVGARAIVGAFTDEAEVLRFGAQALPDRLVRVPVLRLRHGVHAGVQRRRRHLDAHAAELRLLLALGDPARLGAGSRRGLGPAGVFVAIAVAFSTFAVAGGRQCSAAAAEAAPRLRRRYRAGRAARPR